MEVAATSAIGLAVNAIQFAKSGSELCHTFLEIYRSPKGLTQSNEDLQRRIGLIQASLPIFEARLHTYSQFLSGSNRDVQLESVVQRCKHIASDLMGKLEALQVKGQMRWWKAIARTGKNFWEEDEILRLEDELRKYQEVFQWIVTLLTSSESSDSKYQQQRHLNTNPHPPDLVDFIWSQSNMLPVLPTTQAPQHSGHLQNRDPIPNNAVRHVTSQAPEWHQRTTFNTVKSLAEDVKIEHAKHERRILDSLAFLIMWDRENAISKPATGTFDWIFRDSTANGMLLSNFSKWLAVESPPREASSRIYWINGKAGSGKSTLMKHLFHHHQTRTALAGWAHPSNILLVRFFFSHNGDRLQRSQEGLLRSILYACLKNYKQLIWRVVPYHNWSNGDDYRSLWSLDLLQTAFQNLVSQKVVALKFCFFIDGLDEYAGNHLQIINMLMAVAKNTRVKICASSRPLRVFERSLLRSPGLVLQKFTGPAIQHFVRSSLERSNDALRLEKRNPGWIDSLVGYITSKASGVFLWVKLVVGSLLEGLRNCDEASDLRRRLKDLPETLEQAYWHLIWRIRPQFYLKEGFRYLLLVKAAGGSADVLALAFTGMENPPSTTDTPLSMSPILSTQEERCRRLIERIKICCSGLLEVSSSTGEVMTARVKFSHNSVGNFLETKNVRDVIKQSFRGTHFIPEVQTLHGVLWRLKTYHTRQWQCANLRREEFFVHVRPLVNEFINMAWKAEAVARRPDIDNVDELNRVTSALWATVAPKSHLEHLGLIHWTLAPSKAEAVRQSRFPDSHLSWTSALDSVRRTRKIDFNTITTNDTVLPGQVGNLVDTRAFVYYARERGLHLYAASKGLRGN